MRILLAQNSLYYPAHGGGDKSNRLLVEALANHGHECRVVARVHTRFGEEEHRQYLAELERRSVGITSSDGGVVRFRLHGVEVHAVTSHPNFRGYFADQIGGFEPSMIILSTDDPAQVLLEVAAGQSDARLVYLTRTTLALPFGPESAFPSEEKSELLRKTDGVVGVSQYVADYIRQWSGIPAVALPISLMEPGPYPRLARFDNEFVTLVNPCAVKGISIFLALAERLPDVRFAAVPTWGTTEEDLEACHHHANVSVVDPVDNIDDLLKRTRVMLVPSLWAEARGRIIVEAMLRGVPVLASKVGGIPEAMMGVDYLLPVRPVERYYPRVDEQMVPVAQVPKQDVGPWEAALREMVTDRERWEQVSRRSRDAASAYAGNLSIGPFEDFLKDVTAAPPNPLRTQGRGPRGRMGQTSPVDTLSAEKRALLALRLKKRPADAPAMGNPWFPGMEEAAASALRLCCFPYAGGGTSVFRNWAAYMPAGVAVVSARLPGRESRTSEKPIEKIEEMVERMAGALRCCLDRPFAFFGHSMGAMIAFELARYLRRHKLPMPVTLLVAGARAPQFRRAHVPPPAPTDEEFLHELRQLGGVPREILDNEDLLRFLLPALKADSALGRAYVYRDEPPLDVAIRAYVGRGDERLPPAVVQAWSEQTTASFAMREFPGGHFFIHTAEEEFLTALREDLGNLLAVLSGSR